MTDNSYQPSLSGLRAFVAVAQRNHFSSAATHLGISQSSLSQALATLEAGLGVQLVERSTRRVLLTDAGRELLPYARRVTGAYTDFVDAAAGAADPLSRPLRLGLIPTVAPYVLPTILAGVPGERLRVVEDQTARLLTALREAAIDAALVALPSDATGVVEIPLYREGFVVALPPDHAWAGRTDLDPAELADLPLLLLDEGHCLRDQALDICRGAGFRPELGPTRAASLATAVQCVGGGLGVTLIPETAVAVESRVGLGLARFAAPVPGRTIGLVHRAATDRGETFTEWANTLRALITAAGAATPLAG